MPAEILPKYVQIAAKLTRSIEAAKFLPGDRLPSLVEMRQKFGASQATAERAYALLEQEGLITREPKRGIFVAERPPERMRVLGFAMRLSLQRHPYYAHIMHGIQRAARAQGYEVMLLNEDSKVRRGAVAGVLLTWPEFAERLPAGLPAVSIMHPMADVPSVITDDLESSRKLVAHLAQLGHRRIAFCPVNGLDDTQYISQQRLLGYKSGLKAAGIAGKNGWIRPLRHKHDSVREFVELGRNAMKRWLEEDWAQTGCTAIVAHNDEAAIGIIDALNDAKISVPDKVSVTGFDGTDIGRHFRPRLTTMAVPLEEIGVRATEQLLAQLTSTTKPSRNANVDAPLHAHAPLIVASRFQDGSSTASVQLRNQSEIAETQSTPRRQLSGALTAV